ncbi:MAG: hypothetical protein KDC92_07460 [Bacteroidetes bacterium]|nr:hypothetical protein [Bacteroidota bacterium]
MAKTRGIILVLLLFHFVSNAQIKSAQQLQHGLKIYTGSTLFSQRSSQYLNVTSNGFTPAFTIAKPNGNFKEFSVKTLGLTRFGEIPAYEYLNDSSARFGNNTFRFYPVFEGNANLTRGINIKRFRFYAGWYVGLSSNFSRIRETSSRFVVQTTFSNYLFHGVVPRIQYSINNRFTLDFNIPIEIFSGALYTYSNKFNPTVQANTSAHYFFKMQFLRPRIFTPRLGLQFSI